MKSTLLEQIRSYRYLIILLLTLISTYFFIPAPDAIYATLVIDGFRGYYNSAWIGSVGILYTSAFLSLFGFYISKNSITYDKETNVTEIIASTSMKKWQYTLGKVLSNFCILLSMLFVAFFGLIIMQLVRGEEMHLRIWDILAPILFIGVPVLLFTAAIAMLFETIPGLDKAFGNIIYPFLWMGLFLMSAFIANFIDPFGLKIIINSILSQSPIPPLDGSHAISVGELLTEPLPSFTYTGINWTGSIILKRMIWIFVGLGIAFLSSLFFNRFNPERKKIRIKLKERKKQKEKDEKRVKVQKNQFEFDSKSIDERTFSSENLLNVLSSQKYRMRFFYSIRMQLKLYLKQIPLWWKLLILGVNIACIFSPLWITRQYLLPVAWILPITLWSKLGIIEKQKNTSELIFSTPYPIRKNFLNTWLIGLTISLCSGIGGGIKFLITQEWANVIFWIVGCIFIPSFALFLSTLTGSGKAFEFLYTLLWYIGPMNQVAYLDYIGVLGLPLESKIWIIYLTISLTMIVLAYIGRLIQFRKK